MFTSLLRLVRLTFLLLILLGVIVFTVSNRGDITLSLYPLPFEVALPVYLFFLLTLAIGYVWGMFSSGLSTLRHKRTAKKQQAKAEALSQEVSSLRAKEAMATAPVDAPKLSKDERS